MIQSEEGSASEQTGLIETLKSEYGNSTYAVYAALHAAKLAVNQGELDQAASELAWALDRADNRLKPIVRIRQARVQYAQGALDEALTSLDAVEATGFEVAVNELRGDILAAQGDSDAAREAYQTAYDQSQQQGMDSRFLKMKLDDLATAEDNA